MHRFIVAVLGIVLILGSVASFTYVETVEGGLLEGTQREKPYEQYGVPLLIGGLVLMTIAAVYDDYRH